MKLSKSLSATLLGLSLAIMPGAAMAQKAPPPAAKSEAVQPPPPIQIAPAPPPFETAPADGVPFPDAQPSDAHRSLYDSWIGASNQSAMFDQAMAEIEGAWAAMPVFTKLEEESPGFIAELAQSVRPAMEGHNDWVQQRYKPQILAMMAQQVSPEEARSIDEFMRSPLGRNFLSSLISNFSMEAMFEDVEKTDEVTDDQLQRDIVTTATRTVEQMSPEEIAEIGLVMRANPALRKLRPMGEALRGLRLQMENEPLRPETEAEMERAMAEVFERRFPGLAN